MSSYFNCAAFDDVNASIRLNDNVVFLALKVEDKNADMHITLNPFQVRTLAKYLSVALTKIDFVGLLTEKHFGDLTVEIEQDNLHEDFDEEEHLSCSFLNFIINKAPTAASGWGFYFLWRCKMPATKFICPNGERVRLGECLRSCEKRCMFLPTLRAVANSLDRKIAEPTVTELIAGVRETYLKKTSAYAVEPASILYALQGQAIHSINELNTQGAILSEERLKDDITSGQFDLYGKILDADEGVPGDLKVTSSFKLMKALEIYKVKVDTGEIYKSGLKKGRPKFRTELRYDGVRDLLDWSLQLNYYRLLLEQTGFKISRMYIQAICRDASLRIAAERGIDKPVYIIPINKISDRWLTRYFQHKAKLLREAIETKTLPPVCSFRERWGNRKCLCYCAARENCPYAQRLISRKEVIEDELQLSA